MLEGAVCVVDKLQFLHACVAGSSVCVAGSSVCGCVHPCSLGTQKFIDLAESGFYFSFSEGKYFIES